MVKKVQYYNMGAYLIIAEQFLMSSFFTFDNDIIFIRAFYDDIKFK